MAKNIKLTCYNTGCPNNSMCVCDKDFCEYDANLSKPSWNDHDIDFMEQYESRIGEKLAKVLVEIGCPIKVTHYMISTTKHIGHDFLAMRLDSDGNPNGVVNTDPSTFELVERTDYSLPTYDAVVAWFQLKFGIYIGYKFDAEKEDWVDFIWSPHYTFKTHKAHWKSKSDAIEYSIWQAILKIQKNG